MPSLTDTIIPREGLSGYAPVAAPVEPRPPAPVQVAEPGANSFIRCPLPVLWQASPDSLRQFYQGQVPQVRLMLPAAPVSIGSSTTVENVQVSSVSGGSGSAASGSGPSSSATKSVAQVVVTTPVLPPGSKYIGTVLLARSFQLLGVTAQSACRIQMYGTAAAQSLDLSRALDTPPGAGTAQNILCDVVLDTVPYTWGFQNRIGANGDNPQLAQVYVTVTNLGLVSGAETVTIQYVPLES